jgi:putative DNA primase/helicase
MAAEPFGLNRPRLDFPAIARAALPHLPELCRRWLPGGRLVGRNWICGSLRGERGRSCRVSLATGRWADFSTGETGGDAIDLCAAIHRLSPREAAERLAGMLGMGGADHGR